MRRRYISEQDHPINILPPKDITGGAVAQRFTLAEARGASILVQLGVTAAAPTKLLLKGCTDKNGANAEAIPFSIYACETSADDKLGARIPVSAAGYTPTANDNVFYVIEMDAMDLPDFKPWVEFSITAPASSILASAVAVLTGYSFEGSNIGKSAI